MCNLKWVRRPGVIHDRVFLEAISISCLSSLWFQWSLSIEGMKERKKKYKERDGIWEKMKERKKKKCCETKREETIPLKTKTCLPYCGVAVERKTSHMLSSCGYVVNKEPHNKFFFGKVVHYTVNNFLTMNPWLLATNNYLSLMIK